MTIHSSLIAVITSAMLITTAQASSAKEELAGQVDIREQVLSDPESAERGKKKFQSVCAACHGIGGVGGKGKKLKGRTFEAEYLFETITNGRRTGGSVMPPWKNLSEQTRWDLVAYILTLADK